MKLESLEERRLLAITIDTLADELDGSIADDVSLRDAIAAAAEGETIDFSVSGVIELTLGQLSIGKNLKISGPGANLLTIDASGNDPTPGMKNGDGSRVFHVGDGNSGILLNVVFAGLKITGGDSADAGGGIHNENEIVNITGSTISGNAATRGGGLFTNPDGELALVDSTISGNSSLEEGGGVYGSNARVTLTRCVATDNSAGGDGGAVFAYYGDLIVSDSTITGNETGGVGGGLYSSFGNFTVLRSTISGNEAAYGGGVYNYSYATITSSTIDGNSAGEIGGGIYTRGDLTLIDSTISGNSAKQGGGIQSYTDADGRITNVLGSTISGNTATEFGGGFYNYFGLSVIRSSTITNNTAPSGGGGGVASYAGPDTRTEVHSTIIAGNIGSDVDFVNGEVNTFQSDGYNLLGIGNALSAFIDPGDQTLIANPLLASLANNGGPTLTHAPLAGSPSIDSGDPAASAGIGDVPQFDQRGTPFSRVFDGDGLGGARIDIGAFELQPVGPVLTGDYNLNGTVDAADYVVWRDSLTIDVAPFSGADGDGDGVVDQDDFNVWRAHFSETSGSGTEGGAATAAAEPLALATQAIPTEAIAQPAVNMERISESTQTSAPNQTTTPKVSNVNLRARHSTATYRLGLRPLLNAEVSFTVNHRHAELMVLLASGCERSDWEDLSTGNDEDAIVMSDSRLQSIDEVFSMLTTGKLSRLPSGPRAIEQD